MTKKTRKNLKKTEPKAKEQSKKIPWPYPPIQKGEKE